MTARGVVRKKGDTGVPLCSLVACEMTRYSSLPMIQRLPQYLREERRRAGLSQAEVAYLVGAEQRTKISRWERGKHLPTLRTALAYEALLGVPVARLFPAAFTAVRRGLVRRARQRSMKIRMVSLDRGTNERSQDHTLHRG